MDTFHTRSAEVRSTSFNADSMTVDVIWTTGASVPRYSIMEGTFYDEVLSLAPGAVRLGRLNSGAPFLNAHDSSALESVIGAVVPGSARITNGLGYATIRLSSAAADADIVSKIRDGVVRAVSVGYRIYAWEKDAPTTGRETWTAVDWEPTEISAVPIGADAGAQIRAPRTNAQVRADMERRLRTALGKRTAADVRADMTERQRLVGM